MTQQAGKTNSLVEEISRAFKLGRQEQIGAAIEIMTALASEYPTERRVQACLALFLCRDSRFADAIEPARLAVVQSPNSEIASMVLYRALGGSHLYIEALDEMKRYLGKNPSGRYSDILRDLKKNIEDAMEEDDRCESS